MQMPSPFGDVLMHLRYIGLWFRTLWKCIIFYVQKRMVQMHTFIIDKNTTRFLFTVDIITDHVCYWVMD